MIQFINYVNNYHVLNCAMGNHIDHIHYKGGDQPVINPNAEIWYVSRDGQIINPSKTDSFGANIISNEYKGDKGVMLFDGDVITIGNRAFRSVTGLKAIILPESVSSIGSEAFQACLDLTAITIPNNVTSVGVNAFKMCTALQTVVIGNGVNIVEEKVFEDCYNLKSVTFGSNVTLIKDAFFNCEHLEEIVCNAVEVPVLEYEDVFPTSVSAIKVPAESLEAYKEAWSIYSDKIIAI